jgi:geranylgeranyl diphosphate synthase type I
VTTVVNWAAACELLHNGALIHDDMQDGDTVRRGAPTTWVRHGVAQAINAGDLMLILPFHAVDAIDVAPPIKAALHGLLARGCSAIIHGQAAELALTQRNDTGPERYETAVVGKTSALFRLPAEGAAVLAGLDRMAVGDIGAAFQPIGVLFQLQDDVLDLYGDKGRGVAGSDVREGKISALVVEHLARHPQDRRWLFRILNAPRDETGDADVADVMERFRSGGALAAVIDRIRGQTSAALAAPALSAHPCLTSLMGELVDKIVQPVSHLLTA